MRVSSESVRAQHESNDKKITTAATAAAAKNYYESTHAKRIFRKKKNKSQLGNSANKRIVLCYVMLCCVALVNISVNDIVLLFCFIILNSILFFFIMRVFLFVMFLRSFHRISHGMPPFYGSSKLVPGSVSSEFLNEKLPSFLFARIHARTHAHMLVVVFSLPAAKR